MLKKALLLALFYYLLVILLQSCCGDRQYALTEVEEITVYDANDNWITVEDTLRSEFKVLIRYDLTRIAAADFLPINQALAYTSCPKRSSNAVEMDKLEITLDSTITIANRTVSADSDLMAIAEIADLIGNTVYNHPLYAERELVFAQELVDRMNPFFGSLTFSITSYTSDQREIEGNFTVVVDF